MNRGAVRQKIFLDEGDYQFFINLLEDTFKKWRVELYAYCLMGNHFHLLLYELVFGGISRFMQRLSTAYSMYFNLKNERTGILFEGRFHGRHVDNDTYLKYIYSYIHLNPVQHVEPEWKEKGIGNTIF